MMDAHKKFLQEKCAELELDINEQQAQLLIDYLVLLQKWNKAYNLTAITNFREMLIMHVLDSLVIAKYLEGKRFIDVGTGAGLPGIPLAIIMPEREFALLDSNSKKTRFLTQAKLELGIKNITVVHARVEQHKPTELFDAVLSRAFTSLENMLDKTQHLCSNGGHFLAMKGVLPEEEIQESAAIFQCVDAIELFVPGLDAKRHLIRIKKGSAT